MNNVFLVVLGLWSVWCMQAVERQPLLTPAQLVAHMGIDVLKDDASDQEVSTQQLINDITPQLYLKSIDHIVSYIRRAPIAFEQEVELLRDLIALSISYGFTNTDIASLLLGIAQAYPAYSPEQEKIFDLLLTVPGLLYKINPLVITVKRGYALSFKSFDTWLSKHPELADMQKKYIRHVLLYAVQKNDVSMLHVINRDIKSLSAKEATFLLWYAVQQEQGFNVIPELVRLGADINFVHKGKTPLIQAVMNNDKLMVQVLIAQGADVNRIADLEIGSPLQQAIEQRNLEIENILRAAGGHE